MTVEEMYNQMQERVKPVRKECGTCFQMARCWYNDPDNFALDAVKDCWEPRPVPAYIKNLEVK